MAVIDNSALPTLELPGLKHQTVGGSVQGVQGFEVWQQTMAPGAATPVHCHNCQEVILILTGSGTCTMGNEEYTFGPNSTLIVEPDVVHQIINTSDEDMKLVAVFGMAPVRVKDASHAPMPLPWDA
jgi:mannose-6-phosphate isomerase-like protein (cupin superfamily)